MEKINKKTILIAPLDWGLGHTTRCIAIIKTLQQQNYFVIVAATPKQQIVLQQEFANLQYIDLFGYNIKYSKNSTFLAAKIVAQIPKIVKCIYKEHKWLNQLLQQQKIDIVISDNRYGLYNKNVHCIFMTHQLEIQTGNSFLNRIAQKINYHFINKYNMCWVPDINSKNNIAGVLSAPTVVPKTTTHYVGVLSRFDKNTTTNIEYDICIMLSGVEPQRTILENKIVEQLHNFNNKKILLLRGLPNVATQLKIENIVVKNHLQGKELQQAINSSQLIIARSGYTTIMEILALQKPLIVIPTPKQTEQEYLAKYLNNKKYCLAYTQTEFSINKAIEDAAAFSFAKLDDIQYNEKVVLNDCQ